MQLPCAKHRYGAPKFTTSTVLGRQDFSSRLPRWSPTMTSATRGDWRAEIESNGSSNSGSNVGTSGEERGGISSSGKVATATATIPSPTTPLQTVATSSASSSPTSTSNAPPSPWGQPVSKGAAAATSTAPPTQTPIPSALPEKASASSENELSGSISLPTVDLVELLVSPKNQSTAFTALAATSAVLATLCILEPEAVLDLALPKAYPSFLDITFLRIVGVTLAARAAVEYSLKHAAESQLLKSATYQRLMAGCALNSAGFLAALLVNTPATFRVWNSLVWLSYVVTAVAAGAINLTVISHSSGKGLAPPPLDASPPQNPSSWAYTAIIALYLITVITCFAPETLFTGDPYSVVTPLLKGIWAPGFLLAAVMSYVLKDASDRGRLGASTFKNLNLGLAALEYGYSIIFGSAILSDQVDIDLPALSNLGGSLLIATFALYTYATAKK